MGRLGPQAHSDPVVFCQQVNGSRERGNGSFMPYPEELCWLRATSNGWVKTSIVRLSTV